MIYNLLFIVAVLSILIKNTVVQLRLYIPDYDKPAILRFSFWDLFIVLSIISHIYLFFILILSGKWVLFIGLIFVFWLIEKNVDNWLKKEYGENIFLESYQNFKLKG